MGQGAITIGIKDGKTQLNRKYEELNAGEISLLMTNIEMIRDELKEVYKDLINKQQ